MRVCTLVLSILVAVFGPAAAGADLIGHGGMVRSVDISPDGTRVVTGSFDYTARVWNFGDQAEALVLDRHEGPVTGAVFDPSGTRIVTTSDDFTAILWDARSGEMLHRLAGHGHKVMAAAFAPDGQRVATGAWDRKVRVWNVATGDLLTTFETIAPVNALAFVAGGTQLATGGHHPTIELWDAATGERKGALEGHKAGITALDLSPDGTRLLSASIDKTIKLWDIAARAASPSIAARAASLSIDVRDGQVYDARFSPDGVRALTAGKDGYVVEWDLETGQPVHEIDAHDRIVWSVDFTPDGRFAVSSSSDAQARVWHLETGDRIGLTVEAGTEPTPWLQSDHPGAKLYTKCASCHALSAEGPARSGPHFEGLFGRRVGSVAGYRYSDALAGRDFVWDETTLFQLFHEGPDKMLPGTKMPIQRVTDERQLSALVDYLRELTTEAN